MELPIHAAARALAAGPPPDFLVGMAMPCPSIPVQRHRRTSRSVQGFSDYDPGDAGETTVFNAIFHDGIVVLTPLAEPARADASLRIGGDISRLRKLLRRPGAIADDMTLVVATLARGSGSRGAT
jgi:hypothetical protein